MSFDISTATVDRGLKISIYFQSKILYPAKLSIKATGKELCQNKERDQRGGRGEARDPLNRIQPRKQAKEIPQDGSRAKSQDKSSAGLQSHQNRLETPERMPPEGVSLRNT